ncbi:Protein of unknown function [Mucilaginibacter mallensis]|uniref:DUF3606 domain-containing protein n=1 Tax=Mucilaginibacter mallensis TaxID=652787 RepID=A0A1H1VK16_MUCMA|nr:DUF3606 domain-containing protein [Mucilaginibacter mallensis]SDS85103.1 Protein of unknown function [Mucilaginibacter mallensis]
MENQTQDKIISTGDDQELNYWSKEFGIAKEELIAVFKQGGTFASAVENYVKNLQYSL